MTDEAYKSAQDKADELGLSFSSYMSMLDKKYQKEGVRDDISRIAGFKDKEETK